MIADESVAEFISLAGASDEEVNQLTSNNMVTWSLNESISGLKQTIVHSPSAVNHKSIRCGQARGYLEMAGGNLQQANIFAGCWMGL